MASPIQVILHDDVKHLGQVGDLVRVRPGYARNYLIPRGLAIPATRQSIDIIESQQKAARLRAAKNKKHAQGIAAALTEVSISIRKQAGKEGRLFGSVTAIDIATALQAKGYDIDRRKIIMPEESIKTVGKHSVSAKLAPEVTASFEIDVSAQ